MKTHFVPQLSERKSGRHEICCRPVRIDDGVSLLVFNERRPSLIFLVFRETGSYRIQSNWSSRKRNVIWIHAHVMYTTHSGPRINQKGNKSRMIIKLDGLLVIQSSRIKVCEDYRSLANSLKRRLAGRGRAPLSFTMLCRDERKEKKYESLSSTVTT